MAESEVVMRIKRVASLSSRGGGYFENSDTDDDDDNDEDGIVGTDGVERCNSIDEERLSQLPVAKLLPRGCYREGYLYKQGGKKNDQGWKRRWIVFDGQTLRYYKNNKTPESLRIVSVCLMDHVEIVKNGRPASRSSSNLISSSSRQYQFTIKCKNRTFLFGTDDLDNCTQWSNTIMEAILKYQKSNGSTENAFDMTQADLTGCAKFNGKKKRYYIALKGGKFYYYYNEKDFEINVPVHELSMETTNVTEVDGTLQLRAPPNQRFVLQFDNVEDTQQWKVALEDAIASVLGDNEILDHVRAVPGNEVCADCGADNPEWASLNLCIVICKHCAEYMFDDLQRLPIIKRIHRELGVNISKVRSLRMDTKVFNERKSLIKLFERIGNVNANKFWNNRREFYNRQDQSNSIEKHASDTSRKGYIYQKYKHKTFCDLHFFADTAEELNGALFKAVMVSDLLLTMKILNSGADIKCPLGKGSELAVYDMAKEMNDEEMIEYLYQNGGSVEGQPKEQNGQVSVPKCEPVYLDGYLEKTGKNLKGFRKRKCVLQNRVLKYYKDNDLKGSIFMHNVTDISTVGPVDKRLYCFHVDCKTGSNTRTYRFSAADEHTRATWICYMKMKQFYEKCSRAKFRYLTRQRNTIVVCDDSSLKRSKRGYVTTALKFC